MPIATLAYGNNVIVPCSLCKAQDVMIRITKRKNWQPGDRFGGSGQCRKCGGENHMYNVYVPYEAWQPNLAGGRPALIDDMTDHHNRAHNKR